MPFYEYECAACKFYSEVMQKISDPPLKKCPSCGKKAMKKLVSAPNFRLKGGGWYETDFKSEQEKKRNLAVEKEPEPETKPADKADKTDKTETKSSASQDAPTPALPRGAGEGKKAAPVRAKRKSKAKPAAKKRKRR